MIYRDKHGVEVIDIQTENGSLEISQYENEELNFFRIFYNGVSFQVPLTWLKFHCWIDSFNNTESKYNQTYLTMSINSPDIPYSIVNLELDKSEYESIKKDPLLGTLCTSGFYSKEELIPIEDMQDEL